MDPGALVGTSIGQILDPDQVLSGRSNPTLPELKSDFTRVKIPLNRNFLSSFYDKSNNDANIIFSTILINKILLGRIRIRLFFGVNFDHSSRTSQPPTQKKKEKNFCIQIPDYGLWHDHDPYPYSLLFFAYSCFRIKKNHR